MKYLTFFTMSLLLGLAITAPTKNIAANSEDNNDLEKLVIYTGKYDIANLLVSVNSKMADGSGKPALFFALADFTNGQREDKGFYVRKNEKVTKLLDHGRDAVGTFDNSSPVFIATDDGVYTYNYENNKAEKYGTITNDLIGIAKVNDSDIIYTLTKDHILYKMTEQGTKQEKISEVDNAEQIVLDNGNNLFYVAKNHVNILGPKGTRNIEGLPEKWSSIKLIRPPVIMNDTVPILIDNTIYFGFTNGTSKVAQFNMPYRPTAFSLDGVLLIYIGKDKKIYELNVLELILDSVFSKVKKSLENFLSFLRY